MNPLSPSTRMQQESNGGRDAQFRGPVPRRFFWSFPACLAAFMSLWSPFPAAAQSQPPEYEVKAAFIFHFAQLVDWPPYALAEDNRPLVFCTTGEDSASGALESLVRGKHIGPHLVEVRRTPEKDGFRGCQLLFITGGDKKRVASILASLKNAPILTVGESEDFAGDGGMIGLCLQENKIRFDINLTAAQRANLKISSRLLLLAKRVLGDGRQG
ncbi:MAG: YfiR family protein [Candidatus Acidiferrum sp.]